MTILKDYYKNDVYRFDLEFTNNNRIDFTISNVISWDMTRIVMSTQELQGLSSFMDNFVKNHTTGDINENR